MNKTVSNLFYQTIYQLIKIIIPIVTIPIASKALGASGIGLNSFSNSIAQYFVLFSSLGISLYGNREIAINRENKKLKQTFVDIFVMKLLTTMFSLITYGIIIITLFNNQILLFSIQSLYIISVVFDVSWYFMGMEDFKKTSIASFFSQVTVFVLIITFVKTPEDVYLYAIILSIGALLSQIIPIFFLKNLFMDYREIKYAFKLDNIWKHFKGTLKYFMPQVGILLYSTVNRTFLGLFADYESVGYYTNSMSLISAIITVITTIDIVMLPKMANMFSKKEIEKIDDLVSMTLGIELFIAIPSMIGIISISSVFVPWFFGNDFLNLIYILPLESLLIIIVPIGVSISRQYLIPMGNTKDYTISIFIGAGISILLSMLLIGKIGVYGAIVSNISAELLITLYRIFWSKKNTRLQIDIGNLMKILISSFVMGIFTYMIFRYVSINIFSLLLVITMAGIIFLVLCIILKVKEINLIKNIWKR
ncbi:MAG: oligosaccharide flippase family protein [Vagococcus sp.]|jgi:O-antigen/teichoic acid export membrane protein|nr:oligosaccharide flippase family protein [Vagococcus sp.]